MTFYAEVLRTLAECHAFAPAALRLRIEQLLEEDEIAYSDNGSTLALAFPEGDPSVPRCEEVDDHEY